MKKAAILIVAAGLTVVSAPAQGTFGTVYLNNYDSGAGIFQVGFTAAPAGTIVEILGGPNASSLTPIVSTLSGNPTSYTITIGDLNAKGPGTGAFFDYGFGEVIGVAPGGTATLVARAWRNAPTYDAAAIRGTATWTQPTGTEIRPLPAPATLIFPGLVIVPEPSAIVLSVLGAVALVVLRCRR